MFIDTGMEGDTNQQVYENLKEMEFIKREAVSEGSKIEKLGGLGKEVKEEATTEKSDGNKGYGKHMWKYIMHQAGVSVSRYNGPQARGPQARGNDLFQLSWKISHHLLISLLLNDAPSIKAQDEGNL